MSGDLYDGAGDWWLWANPTAVGLTEPSPPPAPPATGLMYEVPPMENFLRNMATGAAGLAHGTGVLATGLLARGAGVLGYEDTFDPAFRYLDQFKDSVDRRYGPRANEHVSGWSRVAGLAGQAAPMIVGTALTGGAGSVAEGASLGMNALRMAAAAAPWSGASALSQTADAVRSHGLSTGQAERMLAGKYGEQELLAAVPFSAGGRFAEAAGLSGLKALPVKAAAGAATQAVAGPAARAVGNLGLDETTREYAEPVAPGWEDLISGAAFGALHRSRGLEVPERDIGDHSGPPPPPSAPPPPPRPPADHSVPPVAPPPAGRGVSRSDQGRGPSLDLNDLNSRPEPRTEADVTQPETENPQRNFDFYSVAAEYRLDPGDFGRDRDVHENRANAGLHGQLQLDPNYADMMGRLIPDVFSSTSSIGGRKTPYGWTWEHASSSTALKEKGVMRLVPRYQHTPGSAWWRALHPDLGGAGGYSEWAIPAGAPRNR